MSRVREEKVKSILEEEKLQALLLFSPENLQHLGGFSGSEGALVITEEDSYLLTDARYTTQAKEESPFLLHRECRRKMEGTLSLLLELKVKYVGFEASALSFADYWQLKRGAPSIQFIPLTTPLDRLRLIKEEEEVNLLKKTVSITSEAFKELVEEIEIGREEREIALELEYLMRKKGAESIPFGLVVASGERSALPHGKASRRRLKEGDLLVIDFGGRYQGYCSDETHTLVMSRATLKQREIYQAVKEAQEKAFSLIKPGLGLKSLDQAARSHLEKKGLEKFFAHGLGHGIGRAVHEEPQISSSSPGLLEEGMVFTVEPGVYIPGWGGIRIEDMVRVTGQGYEPLTFLPKELRIIN